MGCHEDDELRLSGTTTNGAECISTHEDAILNANGTQVHSILAPLDFVPPLLPLPRSSQERALPSRPGAFLVTASGELAYTTIRRDTVALGGADEEPHLDTTTTSEEGLEMVLQQDQHQQQQQPSNHSELAQAWPICPCDPATLAVATPQNQEAAAKDQNNNKCLSNNWKLLLVVLVIGLVSVLASSITIPFILSNEDPYQMEHKQIKQAIIDAFGKEYFDNKQKEKALHWILYEDPRNNALSTNEVGHPIDWIQRFSLVSFYFQTTYQQPWTSCNPPMEKQSDTCFFREFSNLKTDTIGTRWLSSAHECQWMGVSCAIGARHVTNMHLVSNNITAAIPADELAMLTHLEELSLFDNNFTGPIPKRLFEGTTLQGVSLWGNKLTGTIPPEAFAMSRLTRLNVGYNQLTGFIPPEVRHFSGSHVDLTGNLLTESIPDELYTVTDLLAVSLSDNLLTGILSSAIGALTGLVDLRLRGNPISGPLPSQMGLLRVKVLDIQQSRLKGTIPKELYKNIDLKDFWLSGNLLSGTISTRIGLLRNLETFEIANNQMHGTLPTELSSLTRLCSFHVNGNKRLTGSIPDKFCSHVQQTCKIVADCTPIASKGAPAVFCPKSCCSTCCDVQTKICLEQ